MRPSKPFRRGGDLFRERLDAIIDMSHPLVRLGELVPWSDFDAAFGRFYKPVGRPAKPTRLMVGLHYLKHTHDLSDEETVARWVENWNNQSSGVDEGRIILIALASCGKATTCHRSFNKSLLDEPLGYHPVTFSVRVIPIQRIALVVHEVLPNRMLR